MSEDNQESSSESQQQEAVFEKQLGLENRLKVRAEITLMCKFYLARWRSSR